MEDIISKTVTLRLNDKIYNLFRNLAESENRPLSNFIETSVLRFIENSQFIYESTKTDNYSNNQDSERYLSPVSKQKVSTLASNGKSGIILATAASTAPVEIPTKIPSSCAQRTVKR